MQPWQFSLANLLECVTCCAVVSAFAPLIGAAATGCLIAMALAIGAHQGLLALASFMAALLAADLVASHDYPGQAGQPYALATVLVTVLAGALAGWYAARQKVRCGGNRSGRCAVTI